MDRNKVIGKKLIEWGEYFSNTHPNNELMNTWIKELNDDLSKIMKNEEPMLVLMN